MDSATNYIFVMSYSIMHPEMAWSGTGVFATISGRTYSKVNEGEAIIYGIINDSSTGIGLVSKNKDSVTYLPNSSSSPFTSIGSITYNGETWYYSSTEHFIPGKIDIIFANVTTITIVSNYSADAARKALDYYCNG